MIAALFHAGNGAAFFVDGAAKFDGKRGRVVKFEQFRRQERCSGGFGRMAEWWNGLWNGTPAHVAGQILGILLIFPSMFFLFPRDKRKILKIKLFLDIMNTIQYALIGAYAGAVLNFIMCGREIIFLNKGKKRWADSHVWFFVFILLVLVSPVYSIVSGKEGWLAIMPACGSVIAVIALGQENPHRLRILAVVGSVPWLIYAIITGNIGATVTNILVVSAGIAAVFKNLAKDGLIGKNRPKKEETKKEENGQGAAAAGSDA